jgi:putative transposase
MDETQRESIANQRFQLIAPLVKVLKDQRSRGDRYAILRRIAEGKYPGIAMSKKFGLRTLERYLSLYEKGGIDALKPQNRNRKSSIPVGYLDAACKLRRENPSRSIATIIYLLEKSGLVPKGTLKPSTVYDYFTKQQLTRPTRKEQSGSFTRYGASHRGEILQGDTQYSLKLPDPNRPENSRQAFLFAWIDDYSRLVYGQYYWKEHIPALEDSLKKWVVLHGVPQSIYCDNGAVYSSHHLQNICSALGVQLLHSRPYRPQGKGKIEKFFQFVDRSFKSEAELLVIQGKLTTLTDLNNLFSFWLEHSYNRRLHSATKQSPLSRWGGDDYPVKKLPLHDIYEAFLFKTSRSVSKTGIISVDSNQYEVEPFLCGKKVDIRFDPFDLSKGIRVFYDGRQFQNAIPAKIHRHHKKGFDSKTSAPEPPSGLNVLELLQGVELSKRESLKFTNLNQEGDF